MTKEDLSNKINLKSPELVITNKLKKRQHLNIDKRSFHYRRAIENIREKIKLLTSTALQLHPIHTLIQFLPMFNMF